METLFIHLDLKVPVCHYHTHLGMWTVSLGVGALPGCFWDMRLSTIEKEQSQCRWIIENQLSQMDRKPKIPQLCSRTSRVSFWSIFVIWLLCVSPRERVAWGHRFPSSPYPTHMRPWHTSTLPSLNQSWSLVTTHHSAWPRRVSPPNAAPAHRGLPAHDTPPTVQTCSHVLLHSIQLSGPSASNSISSRCSWDQSSGSWDQNPQHRPDLLSTCIFTPRVFHTLSHFYLFLLPKHSRIHTLEPLKDLNPAPRTKPTTREQTRDWGQATENHHM